MITYFIKQRLLALAYHHGKSYRASLTIKLVHADTEFNRFLFFRPNVYALVRTLFKDEVRKYVVSWLEKAEKDWKYPPPEEEKIRSYIRKRVPTGFIPKKTNERDRWYLLIYICCCLIEGFSYGNIYDGDEYMKSRD